MPNIWASKSLIPTIETGRKDMYQLFLWTATFTIILSERLTFSGAPCRQGVAAGWCCYCRREYCSARRRRRCQTPGPSHRSSPEDNQFISQLISYRQCCGSMKFRYGRDPDPGSIPLPNGSGCCYFRQWPSRRQQKVIFAYYFLMVHLDNFSKLKVIQGSHKTIFAWW